jgi:crotonobetainyl-CoA:carnitine CoA-transferase CaiB-like acyl-CoA transferase
MLLQSGVHQRDGAVVRGPELDAPQMGYGPGYRLYRAGDDGWLALVVPDRDAWDRLRELPGLRDLPSAFAPLRGTGDDQTARRAEAVLEAAIASAPAAEWLERLHGAGQLVEPVAAVDRDGFRRGVLDDEVNRSLGRAVEFATTDWGRFEQIGRLERCGPAPAGGAPLHLPGVGEHTVEVLSELGFTAAEVDALLTAKVARQL